MIVFFFIIILEVSFAVHIYFLISYISKKDDKAFKGFLFTAVTNIFLGIFVSVFILVNPRELKEINLERLIFIESGLIFIFMLYVKFRVTRRIYRRTQDPAHYHLSYFGKKVIHASAVEAKDLFIYFLTLPLTLICGAYFVVKLFGK
jgi:hypothetical protein